MATILTWLRQDGSLVEDLVAEPWSPLYDPERAELLGPTLALIDERLPTPNHLMLEAD